MLFIRTRPKPNSRLPPISCSAPSLAPQPVKEKAKSLHISLDNLCQFLPQDKVKEFAE